MAASQKPVQGSLFREEKESKINKGTQIQTSTTSKENLSNEKLKTDAKPMIAGC